MKKGIFALFAILLPPTLSAQESQTAYNFLRLPVSAHASALGGENISIIEDDASLIFSNPALLSSVSDRSIGLNYMNYMSGVNTASATYSTVLADRLTVGGSAQYFGYGSMKEVDENNNITGTFSARDISLGAYVSYNLSQRLSMQLFFKYDMTNPFIANAYKTTNVFAGITARFSLSQ